MQILISLDLYLPFMRISNIVILLTIAQTSRKPISKGIKKIRIKTIRPTSHIEKNIIYDKQIDEIFGIENEDNIKNVDTKKEESNMNRSKIYDTNNKDENENEKSRNDIKLKNDKKTGDMISYGKVLFIVCIAITVFILSYKAYIRWLKPMFNSRDNNGAEQTQVESELRSEVAYFKMPNSLDDIIATGTDEATIASNTAEELERELRFNQSSESFNMSVADRIRILETSITEAKSSRIEIKRTIDESVCR